MIIYFSGTGNTKFVADCLADSLHDELTDLADFTRAGRPLRSESARPHVFLAPIYAWRFPRVVEELIRNAALSGSRDVYCVATRESQSGRAGDYLRRIVEAKGLTFKGFTSVDMPNEYLLSDPVSPPEETAACLRAILPELRRLAERISGGLELSDHGNVGLPGVMSGIVNAAANRFLMTSGRFAVSDACVGCGACAKRCPMANIVMETGRPKFGKTCTWCFSCVQHCPQSAIDIGKRTVGKPRYVCPDYQRFIKENA